MIAAIAGAMPKPILKPPLATKWPGRPGQPPSSGARLCARGRTPAQARLTLKTEHALGRMLRLPVDLALGEAYLRGDFDIEGDFGAVAGLAQRWGVTVLLKGRITLVAEPDGTVRETYVSLVEGRGMQYQALYAEQLIADGRHDSDLLPFDESIRIMGTLDEVRRQIGVVYPR